jgi:hypothetical protein
MTIDEYVFPQGSEPNGPYGGLTLRDYFAAHVIGHLVASSNETIQEDVKAAYLYADAMLKQRREPTEN